MRRPVGHTERGFSLGEVLVATLVLAIGLVGIATGFQYATSGVEIGKGETTAAFLAEQRLEWLKAIALTNWASATLKAGTTIEGYGSIADASFYRRVHRELQARPGHRLLPAGHGARAARSGTAARCGHDARNPKLTHVTR